MKCKLGKMEGMEGMGVAECMVEVICMVEVKYTKMVNISSEYIEVVVD